jgi:coenzyme F420-reducing hydrogenase delta subunit
VSESFAGAPRVLVYACDHAAAKELSNKNTKIITMPCVAMLPPSFIDFVLSRGLAEGVMLAGCAEGDCYYRLGGSWTRDRIAGERDPYLRKRVDRERLSLSWLPSGSKRRRASALAEFSAALESMPANTSKRRADRE